MGERLAQKVALIAQVDPSGILASSTGISDVIDASLYDSLMFVLCVGTMTSSGKVTMTVYKGTTSTVGSITSSVASVVLTCTGGTDADEQAIIDVDVSKETNKQYYKAKILANGATTTGKAYYSMSVFADSTRFHPATDNDLASVKTIVYA
jgi:hypothetical protein